MALLGGTQPGGLFGSSNIFLENVDGSNRVQLTSGYGRHLALDWSPDGTPIAYQISGGEFPPSNIFVINANGTGRHRVTSGTHWDAGPSWSPDGSVIAFASDRAGNPNYEIYTVRPNGMDIRRLTRLKGDDVGPDWSPNGAFIAFSHKLNGICVMPRDGSTMRRLTTCRVDHCFEEDQPDWSPGGTRIVFTWGRDPHYEIRAVRSDGSGERVLLNCLGPCLAVGEPTWSPDGSTIAFTYFDQQATRHAYVMSSDGSNPRPLPSGDIATCCVAWQPGA